MAANPEGNLNPKQVEFSKNIHAAGADLLNLISDILDLSKIESGTVTVEPEEVSFAQIEGRRGAKLSPRRRSEASVLRY